MGMATEAEKAWMAGFFDGEGFVVVRFVRNANRITYALQLGISNTDYNSLDLFVELYGGSIGIRSREGNRKKENTWWCIAKERETFLKDILPYLRLKRKRVELALRFISLGDGRTFRTQENENKDWRGRTADDSFFASQRGIFEEMTVLNKRGLM